MVRKHLPHVHAHTDDTQLYLSFKPDCASSSRDVITAMERYVQDRRSWMLTDKLKLNDDKTEFMVTGMSSIIQGGC